MGIQCCMQRDASSACDPVALGTDQKVVHEGVVWKLIPGRDPRVRENWLRSILWITGAGGLFYSMAGDSAECGCRVAGMHVMAMPQYLEDRFAFEVRPAGVATSGTLFAVAELEDRDTWLRLLMEIAGPGGERNNLSPFDIYGKKDFNGRRRSGSLESLAEAASGAQAPTAPSAAVAAALAAGAAAPRVTAAEEENETGYQLSPGRGWTVSPCVRRNSQNRYAEKLHTSLLLDWDDTIFPTTWVRKDCGLNWRLSLDEQLEPGPRRDLIISLLQRLLQRAQEFLNEASQHANIFIVTLARRPWVETSLQNFLPGLKGVIEVLSIRVIYAQEYVREDATEDGGFQSSEQAVRFWTHVKREAIAKELGEFHAKNGASWKNILSVGDSDFERYGTLKAGEDYMRREMEGGGLLTHLNLNAAGFAHTAEGVSKDGHLRRLRTKTVKLLNEPTVEELTAELALLRRWLPHMVRKDDGFDMELDSTDNDERLRELDKQVTGETANISWMELAGMVPYAQ